MDYRSRFRDISETIAEELIWAIFDESAIEIIKYMDNLRQIKQNTLLIITITILIFFLIGFNFVVSKERNIEIDAGRYLIKNGIKDSVKLINAEGVGYYGGLSSEQIMIASDSGLHNTEWVVFFGNITDQDKILGSDYSLKKMFKKNNQGIFIFKKVKDAK